MATIHQDSFTQVSDTNLENHTPEVGTGYTKLTALNTGTLRVVGGQNYVQSVSGTQFYEADGTSTVNGAVEATLQIDALGNHTPGFMWRIQSSDGGLTRYQYYVNALRNRELVRYDNGTPTVIWTGSKYASGESHFTRVEFTGDTIDVYEDSVLLTSQTDSGITGAGTVGLTCKNNGRVAATVDGDFKIEDDSSAASLVITGTLSGEVGQASATLTVTATNPEAGGTTVSLTDGGAGGVFTPSSASVSTATPSFNFTYTPSSAGDVTLTADDAGSVFPAYDATFQAYVQDATLHSAGGMWTWFSDPRILIDGDYIFAGHMTSTVGVSDLVVTRIQISTGAVTDTVIEADFQNDDHDNPTFIKLDNGKLVAFYTLHSDTTGLRYKVTTNAVPDSTAWGSELNTGLGGEANVTYSNPFIASDGTVYVFQRSRGNPTISMLSCTQANLELGTGWTRTTVARSGNTSRFYAKYCQNGADRVDVFTTDAHPNEGAASLYHFYVDFTGGTPSYHTSDGTEILTTLPLDESDWTLIQDGTDADGRCWTWQIRPDDAGNPRCLASRYPTGSNAINGTALDQIDYWGYRWTGTSWTGFKLFDNVGKSLYDGESYYTGGLTFAGGDLARVYVSLAPSNTSNRYEIQEYTIDWSGTSVAKVRDITKNSLEDMHARPYSPEQTHIDYHVFWWGGRYTSFNDHSTSLFSAAAVSQGVSGSASLSGSGTLSVSAETAVLAESSLTAASSLVVSAESSLQASASIAGSATLTVGASSELTAAASLSSSANIIVAAQSGISAFASLSASGSLVVAAQSALTAQASFTGSGILAVSATTGLEAAASLTSTSSLVVSAELSLIASASLAGSGLLSISAQAAMNAQTSLSSTTTVSVSVTLGGWRQISPGPDLWNTLLAGTPIWVKQ